MLCRTLLFATLLLSIPQLAYAAPKVPSALNLVRAEGAESCIDAAAASIRIEALTGPVLVPSSQAKHIVEVQLSPHEGGFRARIALFDARGNQLGLRSLDESSSRCRALDDALVFVVALIVDPDLTASGLPAELQRMFGAEEKPEERLLAELPTQPTPPVAYEPPAPPAPSPAFSSPQPAKKARRDLHTRATIGAAGSWVALPFAHWGLAVAAQTDALRFAWLAASVRVFPFQQSHTVASGEQLRIRQYQAQIALCSQPWKVGSLQLSACAGLDLHTTVGHGAGFVNDHRARLWSPGAVAAAQMHVPITSRFALSGELAGRVGFTNPSFVSDTGSARDSVLRPNRFGLFATVGLSVDF